MKQRMAIEMVALQPEMTNKHLSEQLGISYKRACAWRNNPKFIEQTVDRFIEICGNEIPLVLKALIREAKEGNTRAAEIFLKQVGRLQETLTVKIEAPFMQHLKQKRGAINVEDAVELSTEVEQAMAQIDIEELPPRDIKNNKPIRQVNKDFKETKQAIERAKKNANRNERYALRKRAEAVGLEPLKGGRPHPAKRKSWLNKLKRLERAKLES